MPRCMIETKIIAYWTALDSLGPFRYNAAHCANVAQLVEQLFRKQQVESSSLSIGSTQSGVVMTRAEVILRGSPGPRAVCDSIQRAAQSLGKQIRLELVG